jgi:hypothetical protein
VCRLKKGLYGLKQAERNWNQVITASLTSMGFHPMSGDARAFVHGQKNTIIGLYVDDLLIAAQSMRVIAWIKSELQGRHKMKDLGQAKICLGIQIRREHARGTLTIGQSQYVQMILARFNQEHGRAVRYPAESYKGLESAQPGDEAFDPARYQQAVGSLMWAMTGTRPDIAYAVGKLSRHCNSPTRRHWTAVQRVFRYLRGTASYSISYQATGESADLVSFSDADYAGDTDDRKSTSGEVFTYAEGALVWSSKWQTSTATSTAEAEYMALSRAGKIAKWLRTLLGEFGAKDVLPGSIPLYFDNAAALALAKDPHDHGRTKHVDVYYHFVLELVERAIIKIEYQPTTEMAADGLTKPLTGKLYERFVRSIGIVKA